MQTTVEWLVEMLIDNKYLIKDATHLFEQAKQMENAEIIKRTLDGAEDTADYVDKVIIKALVEDMHKQPLTFVSKEISDEEIEKFASDFYDNNGADEFIIIGAKWYREQLKKNI